MELAGFVLNSEEQREATEWTCVRDESAFISVLAVERFLPPTLSIAVT